MWLPVLNVSYEHQPSLNRFNLYPVRGRRPHGSKMPPQDGESLTRPHGRDSMQSNVYVSTLAFRWFGLRHNRDDRRWARSKTLSQC